MVKVSRRGVLAAAACWWACGDGRRAPLVKPSGPKLSANPFELGVASGDPFPDSVMLWTRLVGDAVASDDIEVGFELATEPEFRTVVQKGVIRATAESAHSVHVEVAGLESNRWYWYRFVAPGQHESLVGRTRTAPRFDDAKARLKVLLASCQNFEDGYFSAHVHAAREDVDLLFFLGDSIYEDDGTDGVRVNATAAPVDLEGYRARHAEYRRDPSLQAMHAAYPWVSTWDDHEVRNDYAGLVPLKARDLPTFPAMRAAAYQAFFEHNPTRRSEGTRLYRSLRWGTVADVSVLDTRQYRSGIICGGEVAAPCPTWGSPNDTFLGAEQREWLLGRLTAPSEARWQVLAQQVLFSQLTLDRSLIAYDSWDGFPYERQVLLDALNSVNKENVIVLTGDIHCAGLSQVTADAFDAASPVVLTEIVTNSLTSGGTTGGVAGLVVEGFPGTPNAPNLAYAMASRRGYTVCDVTPDGWDVQYRVVDTVDQPEASLSTHARFAINPGRSAKLRRMTP